MFCASRLVFAALIPFVFPANAFAAQDQEFIEFAGSHCRAFLSDGRADMGFALGKALNKFSESEMFEFNRQFARNVIEQYNIDPTKGCVLDVLTMKSVNDTGNKPAEHGRYARPKPEHTVAVVAGVMGTKGAEAPVSVAYRFERIGISPWVITNVTLNGQPLVDRYREEYEAMAAKGGSEAVLEQM
jgi:ABC-type transporter MlaC component